MELSASVPGKLSCKFQRPMLNRGGPRQDCGGIHRLYLSQHVYNQSNERILLCTFSKKLAKYTKPMLTVFCQRGIEEHNIDVAGVDSLIFNLLRNGCDSTIVNEQDQLFEDSQGDHSRGIARVFPV